MIVLMKSKFFDQLYQQYWPELCVRLQARFGAGPPDPEDIAQQAFCKYSELCNEQRIDNPKAFIYTVARNLFIDQFRRIDKQQQVMDQIFEELDIAPVYEDSAEQSALQTERNALIEKAISTFSEKQKQLMTMSIIEGKSYRQIAQETGLPIANISRTITAAQTLLDQTIRTWEYDGSVDNVTYLLKEGSGQ